MPFKNLEFVLCQMEAKEKFSAGKRVHLRKCACWEAHLGGRVNKELRRKTRWSQRAVAVIPVREKET